MNVAEAHAYLEDLQREFTKHRNAYAEELITANGIAILALEKQIPKKLFIPKKGFWKCPTCGAVPGNGDFCPMCGQALDWRKSYETDI